MTMKYMKYNKNNKIVVITMKCNKNNKIVVI